MMFSGEAKKAIRTLTILLGITLLNPIDLLAGDQLGPECKEAMSTPITGQKGITLLDVFRSYPVVQDYPGVKEWLGDSLAKRTTPVRRVDRSSKKKKAIRKGTRRRAVVPEK